jgi:hypothetical protein
MQYETTITWQGEQVEVLVDIDYTSEAVEHGDGKEWVEHTWTITGVTDIHGEYTFTPADFAAVTRELDDTTVQAAIDEWGC